MGLMAALVAEGTAAGAAGIDFGSMFGTIQTTAMHAINSVLPIALSIFGIFVAVKLGIKVFNRVTGR